MLFIYLVYYIFFVLTHLIPASWREWLSFSLKVVIVGSERKHPFDTVVSNPNRRLEPL